MIRSRAERAPFASGANLTWTAHRPPAGRVTSVQSSAESLNWSASAPTMEAPLSRIGVAPSLLSSNLCPALLLPTACRPKSWASGVSEASGSTPSPVKFIWKGWPWSPTRVNVAAFAPALSGWKRT